MNISKLSYTKEDADKNVLPIQQQPPQLKESVDPNAQIGEASILSRSLAEGYTKQEGELSPALYFVISGGEIRERNYLQAIEKKQEFSSLRIIFMTSERGKGGLTPQMMYARVETAFSNGYIEQNGVHYDIMEIDAVYLLTDVDHYSKDEIAEIDSQITGLLSEFPLKKERTNISEEKKPKYRKKNKNDIRSEKDLQDMLYHILGTDMTAITGLQPNTVLQIIAEVGTDMSKFPTCNHFASYLGFVPRNQITGGEISTCCFLPENSTTICVE